jgi:CubicO group peptidase (beta-lactamase class C family)
LEEVSGAPFTEVMQQRIFDPLGMNDLTYDPLAAMTGDHATGHGMNLDGSISKWEFSDFGCAIAWPPGILFGTVIDLARFAEMQLANGGDVLSADAAERMRSPLAATHMTPDDYYGYGLLSFDYKGVRMVWHDGGIEGFTTFWLIVPERDFGAVVFVNADYYYPADIALKAADLFLELPDEEPPDYSTPPATWGRYTGDYFEPYAFGRIHVYQDAELKMFASFPDIFGVTTELVQYAADTFIIVYRNVGLITVTFFLDEEGQGEYFATRAGVGKRVEAAQFLPPPEQPPLSVDEWARRIYRPGPWLRPGFRVR